MVMRDMVTCHAGVLICTIVLDYVSSTKRYCPEVLAFLNSVLSLAHPGVFVVDTLPAFGVLTEKGQALLVVKRPKAMRAFAPKPIDLCLLQEASQATASDAIRLDITACVLRLLQRFADLWKGQDGM